MALHKPYMSDEVTLAVSGRFDDAGNVFDLATRQSNFKPNMKKLKSLLGLSALAMVHQVHGSKIVEVNDDNLADAPEADGLFTTSKNLGLIIRQADCQAVVLSAPGLVANLHVGWRGNVLNFPGRGLNFLSKRFNIAPRHFKAYVSPSLGPCHAEFINYQQEFPQELWPFLVNCNHLNLWAITCWQLTQAGLPHANLQISALCNKCDDNLFSYRQGDAARSATVVALN